MIRKTGCLCIFLAGGAIYGLIEVLWRGYTHPSMVFAGGLCLLLIHIVNQKLHSKNILLKCLSGAVIITTVEFTVGVIVNLVLKLNVWDYSAMPGNVLGQICPLFSLMWFAITIPACALSDVTEKMVLWMENRERE